MRFRDLRKVGKDEGVIVDTERNLEQLEEWREQRKPTCLEILNNGD